MNAALGAFVTLVALILFGAIAYERSRAYALQLHLVRASALVPALLAAACGVALAREGAATYTSAVFLSCAAICTTTDLQTGYIFDRVLLAAAALLLVQLFVQGVFADRAAGTALAGAAFLVPYVWSRGRGIGLGDGKFAALIGFALGLSQTAVALWIAVVCGGAVAALLLACRRAGRCDAVRFGPFLALGAACAMLRHP